MCIFAYGQTGSGKTYTMVGPSEPQHRGVIPRAVHQLFEASHQLEEQGWTFEMRVSVSGCKIIFLMQSQAGEIGFRSCQPQQRKPSLVKIH